VDFLPQLLDALDQGSSRAVLVGSDGGEVSGRELLDHVARCRGVLHQRGVSAGDRVVLVAANSPAWVAWDLAVLAAGAVLVPFDPRLDTEAAAFQIKDCEPTLIVADDVARLEQAAAGVPTLATSAAPPDAAAAPDLHAGAEGDPAVIIYTSGSTGRPKGVVLSRGNVGFMLSRTHDRLAELTGLAPGEERAVHYLPFCYAGSWVLLHTVLLRGARLRLVADPKLLVDALATAQPDYFLNVPLLLERVRAGVQAGVRARGATPTRLLAECEAAWARQEAGARLGWRDRLVLSLGRWLLFGAVRARFGPRLKGLICGSAPLAPETQSFFRMLGVEVYQAYGLTETTALCTLDRPLDARPGTVGVALPGVAMRTSREGEVQTQGPHVFTGYWRQPEATQEVMTADGWFKTGDLGAMDEADGRWSIEGRKTALLVLQSGINVPPEPIEDALRLRLGGEAQVLLVGHGHAHLAALVAGAEASEVEAAVATLNETLPGPRRIKAWAALEEPWTVDSGLLTTNLKLRRRLIAERHAARIEALLAPREVVST
jgi:long-chain acyl-CoA synthetase